MAKMIFDEIPRSYEALLLWNSTGDGRNVDQQGRIQPERVQSGVMPGSRARPHSEMSTAGGKIAVNSTVSDIQIGQAIAMAATGEFAIVWHSGDQNDPGKNNTGVYGHLFDDTRSATGDEFLVNQTTASDQQAADVAIHEDRT